MLILNRLLKAGAALALALFVSSAFISGAYASDIQAALSGRTAFEASKTYRPWRQYFAADGTTIYFGDGPSSIGKWEVRGNQYCSLWPPVRDWECYNVEIVPATGAAYSIVWIAKDGSRIVADLYDGEQTALKSPPKR